MNIVNNVGDIIECIFDFMQTDLNPLPFTLFDVLIWTMLGSVVAYFYRKVMGDD